MRRTAWIGTSVDTGYPPLVDLQKLLKSFEELLFELLSWLIFFPRTLWRVVWKPLETVRYSNHEQSEAEKERYTDSISPPLFLLLCIGAGHAIALMLKAPQLQTTTDLGQIFVSSEENTVLATAFLYALLPLFAAWRYTAAKGMPLERGHLRPPFYGQCYLAGAYGLVLASTVAMAQSNLTSLRIPGMAGAVVATAWYLSVQTLVFRDSLGWPTARAALLAIRAYAEAVFAFIVAALIITGLPTA